jgi:hypothetical protein
MPPQLLPCTNKQTPTSRIIKNLNIFYAFNSYIFHCMEIALLQDCHNVYVLCICIVNSLSESV